MNVNYSLAAATAIMNNGTADITGDERLADVKDGDLMLCVTMIDGTNLTIPAAHCRIVGPSEVRGLFDAVIQGIHFNSLMCHLKAANIEAVDYFTI